MKKIILSAAAVALVAGATYLSTQKISAFMGNSDNNPMIAKLAQRFNLNQDDLKKFFEEQRQEHQAEMQSKFEEKLDQAVTLGKLTAAQKSLILQKHEEMKKEFQENSEDRKKRGEELKAWTDENGIGMQYLMMGQGTGRALHPAYRFNTK